MNRAIKFRVWDAEIEKFRNPNTIFLNHDGTVFILVAGEFGIHAEFIEDVVIQQFIGLTDKNGKEIFEGDILERFTRDKFIVEPKSYSFSSGGVSILGYEIHKEDEIIGNIYENPELLCKTQ